MSLYVLYCSINYFYVRYQSGTEQCYNTGYWLHLLFYYLVFLFVSLWSNNCTDRLGRQVQASCLTETNWLWNLIGNLWTRFKKKYWRDCKISISVLHHSALYHKTHPPITYTFSYHAGYYKLIRSPFLNTYFIWLHFFFWGRFIAKLIFLLLANILHYCSMMDH